METLQRTANRGSISTGYDIDNSLKFESDNGEICKMNFSTGGSNQIFTWSFWCKRTELSTLAIVMGNGVSGNDAVYCEFSSDALRILSKISASTQFDLITDRLFRDTSAWYHIVIAVDTTQATSSDRVKLYVNGVQETSFSTETYPSQNANTYMGNGGGQVQVGSINSSGSSYNGYLTEVFCIEGQQLDATDFGEFDSATGIWKPKAYTGTFGTNYAFYLKFDDVASLGADSSGLGNNFSLTNITSIDQATDTPTNNFATLNPLVFINSTLTYTDGATEAASSAINSLAEGTIGFTNGNWYYEIVMPAASPNPNANMMMGFGRPNLWGIGETDPGMDTYSFAYNRTGVVFYNGTTTSGWSAYSKDDVVMVAIDTTNGFAYFGVNGTWGNGGVPTSGSSGTGAFDYDSLVTNVAIGDLLIPAFSTGNAGNILQINFGGYTEVSIASGNADSSGYGNFEYAPPSGYYALCSKNLAEFG